MFVRPAFGGRRSLVLMMIASIGLVICTGAPRPAMGQIEEGESRRGSLIDSGKTLFEARRYEQSIETLSAALLRPATSKGERIEVYRYLAYNYLVLSQTEEAEAAVRGLYVLDPEFALANTESPRFRTFFDEVKKRWEQEGRPGLVKDTAPTPLSIRHVSPAEWELGKQIHVTGQIVDPGNRAAFIIVRYRTGSKGEFRRLEARLGQGRFRSTIPGMAVKPPIVEYYIEAIDDSGLPIATRGDAAGPMRIAIPDLDKGASFFASPWFWVAAAAVVVGGVAGAILLRSDSGPGGHQPNQNVAKLGVTVVIGN